MDCESFVKIESNRQPYSVYVSRRILSEICCKYKKNEKYIRKLIGKTIDEGVEITHLRKFQRTVGIGSGSGNSLVSQVHMQITDDSKFFIEKVKIKRKMSARDALPKCATVCARKSCSLRKRKRRQTEAVSPSEGDMFCASPSDVGVISDRLEGMRRKFEGHESRWGENGGEGKRKKIMQKIRNWGNLEEMAKDHEGAFIHLKKQFQGYISKG